MVDVPQQLKRRVAVLTHYLPPYIAHVFQHLARSVPQMRILLSIPVEPNRRYENDWSGLQVDVQKSWMIRRPWKHDGGFQDELYVHVPYDTLWRLRRIKPEIILSFELGFRSLASALYRRGNRNCRLAFCICVSERTERGRGSARWLLRKTLLKLADAVTYNGPSCRQYLEGFGVPTDKLYHIPYAAQEQYRTADSVERSSDAEKRLIYVGQLTERKGVLPMLRELSSYCRQRPQQRLELSIVGSGALESAVSTYKTPENLLVKMHGYVDPTNMPALLRQHGVLILPTLADEWGLVINEALHTGMPAIGSEFAQACTTLIKEGDNGWLYSPERPGELHAKLDRFFSLSSTELHVMRLHARQSVQHITSAAVSEQLLIMFRQLSQSFDECAQDQ